MICISETNPFLCQTVLNPSIWLSQSLTIATNIPQEPHHATCCSTHTTVQWTFVWDYPGGPVPEETFTHLHTSFTTHTHKHLTALCLGLPGWPGTRTHSHPWGRRRIHTDNTVHCMGAHPPYSAISQWGLLDPIKPAYDQINSQCL